jgi:GGDEF domain-containing protein
MVLAVAVCAVSLGGLILLGRLSSRLDEGARFGLFLLAGLASALLGGLVAYDLAWQRQRRALAALEARIVERLTSYDPAGSLFSAEFLRTRLEQECRRSNRYGLSLAVIAVRVLTSRGAGELQTWARISHFMVSTAARALRSEDFAGYIGGLTYAFVLPHTDRAGAEVVLKRLGEQTAAFRPGIGLGLAIYREDGGDTAELLTAAQTDIVHRLRSDTLKAAWNEGTSLD